MGLRSSVARSRGSGDERGCAVVVARARLLACACGHATCAAAAADDDDARGDRRSDASRAFLGALGAVAGSPSSERASSSSAFGADKRCALTGEVAADPAAASAAGSEGVLRHGCAKCSLRAAAAGRRAGKSMVSTSTWSVPDGVHRNETRCARLRCAAAPSSRSSWATSVSNGTESTWCLRRSSSHEASASNERATAPTVSNGRAVSTVMLRGSSSGLLIGVSGARGDALSRAKSDKVDTSVNAF